jgi:hypothetical protein
MHNCLPMARRESPEALSRAISAGKTFRRGRPISRPLERATASPRAVQRIRNEPRRNTSRRNDLFFVARTVGPKNFQMCGATLLRRAVSLIPGHLGSNRRGLPPRPGRASAFGPGPSVRGYRDFFSPLDSNLTDPAETRKLQFQVVLPGHSAQQPI